MKLMTNNYKLLTDVRYKKIQNILKLCSVNETIQAMLVVVFIIVKLLFNCSSVYFDTGDQEAKGSGWTRTEPLH